MSVIQFQYDYDMVHKYLCTKHLGSKLRMNVVLFSSGGIREFFHIHFIIWSDGLDKLPCYYTEDERTSNQV